jgi:hypothetical protein
MDVSFVREEADPYGMTTRKGRANATAKEEADSQRE